VPLTPPKVGELLAMEVRAENLPMLTGVEFDLIYNPEFMEIIRVSRGLFFIENKTMTPWHSGTINGFEGKIVKIGGERTSSAGDSSLLATIYCKLGTKPGEFAIAPLNIQLQSKLDKIPSYQVKGLGLVINEKGGVQSVSYNVDQ
jgi:hypothetical protein